MAGTCNAGVVPYAKTAVTAIEAADLLAKRAFDDTQTAAVAL